MPVTINCKHCGSGFDVKPSHADKRVYCSKACMATAYRNDPIKKTCETCGKDFEVLYKQRVNARFCSKGCMGKGQTGAAHWNYQHGQGWTPEKESAYKKKYYAENKEKAHERAFLHKPKSRTGLKVTGSHTMVQWLELVALNNGKCFYCGIETTQEEGKRKLTRDHLYPLSRGGTDDISNIVVSCKSCNGSKADKTLEEWETCDGHRNRVYGR